MESSHTATKYLNIFARGYISTATFLIVSMVACLLPRLISSSTVVKKYFSLLVDIILHIILGENHIHNSSEFLPFYHTLEYAYSACESFDVLLLHSSPVKGAKKKRTWRHRIHNEFDHHMVEIHVVEHISHVTWSPRRSYTIDYISHIPLNNTDIYKMYNFDAEPEFYYNMSLPKRDPRLKFLYAVLSNVTGVSTNIFLR